MDPFHGITEIIGRHHRLSDADPASGTFELRDDDRAIPVTLDPVLLAEYIDRLAENDITGPDRARAKHVAMEIEEIFESDIFLSLVEIRLDRSADGQVSLLDRRGPAQRSLPAAGGTWSA